MLRVLGKASSINVRKVLWACEEIAIAYEREDWGSGFRDTGDPRFLALNPNALVPVIVDGDVVLWESNTIIRYLASSRGRADLLPAAPRARAGVERWMDWQASDLNWSWRYAFQALVRKSIAAPSEAELARSIADWSRLMRLLDAELARTRAFVTGAAFTLADIPIGLSVQRWFMTPIPDRPELAAVAAYYDRLAERPGYRRHGRNGVA